MTLGARVLGTWAVSAYGVLAVDVTGANPVHALAVDFAGDGQPAWYYVVWDARPTGQYWVGPLKKAGRFQMSVSARDERGCEIQNAPGQYVTITR